MNKYRLSEQTRRVETTVDSQRTILTLHQVIAVVDFCGYQGRNIWRLGGICQQSQTATPVCGIIYEIFKTQPGKTFSAQPLPAAEMKKQLAQKSACGKDNIYFSLRYLPAARDILPY